jgi:hypothetical protein
LAVRQRCTAPDTECDNSGWRGGPRTIDFDWGIQPEVHDDRAPSNAADNDADRPSVEFKLHAIKPITLAHQKSIADDNNQKKMMS